MGGFRAACQRRGGIPETRGKGNPHREGMLVRSFKRVPHSGREILVQRGGQRRSRGKGGVLHRITEGETKSRRSVAVKGRGFESGS